MLRRTRGKRGNSGVLHIRISTTPGYKLAIIIGNHDVFWHSGCAPGSDRCSMRGVPPDNARCSRSTNGYTGRTSGHKICSGDSYSGTSRCPAGTRKDAGKCGWIDPKRCYDRVFLTHIGEYIWAWNDSSRYPVNNDIGYRVTGSWCYHKGRGISIVHT